MKSLASLCTAVGLFCVVPISSPPLASGSARSLSPANSAAPSLPASATSLPASAPSTLEPQDVAASAPIALADFEPAVSGPYFGAPPVTRLQILEIARSAVGIAYVRGAESWPHAGRAGLGTDCSGLIAKAWQVPRAVESWEELAARPTTETLNVTTSRWHKLPIAERQPGDALVRYEDVVRHAFIYDKDAENFAESGEIWVYEAVAPEVQHKRYRLSELTAYTLVRRRGIDDVGLVGRGRNWLFGDLVDVFRMAGGEAVVGTPYDRGEGVLVHQFASRDDFGVAQDFRGGQLGEAMLVQSQRDSRAFLLTGDELEAYRVRYRPRGRRSQPVVGDPRLQRSSEARLAVKNAPR